MTQKISRREFLKLSGSTMLSLSTAANLFTKLYTNGITDGIRSTNILVLIFDTLSARHMSLYGYERATTPNFSRFAERANVYHSHYATANFTSPGAASILTGTYPWAHRAIQLNDILNQQGVETNLFSLLNPSHHINTYTHNPLAGIQFSQLKRQIDELEPVNTLKFIGEVSAEKLFPADFPVALWSELILRGTIKSMPGALILPTIQGKYLTSRIKRYQEVSAGKYPRGLPFNQKGMYFLLEEAIDWIQDKLLSLPTSYLAYYHLWPPHDPYTPSADFVDIFADGKSWPEKPDHEFTVGISAEEIKRNRQEYDEYIAFVDSEFGRLIDFMEKEHIYENTMVILTSDHGELFERGILGHLTPTLYENLIRVPLLISLPNQQMRQDFYSSTSAVDLLPSILHFLGLPIPDTVEGQVLPGFGIGEDVKDRTIYAIEAKPNSKFGPFSKGTFVMRNGDYKFIRYQGYDRVLPDELYDLENDPEELVNLSFTNKSLAADFSLDLSDKLREINLPYQNESR